MSRKYGIPIYGTAGTLGRVAEMSSLGKVDPELFWMVRADQDFRLGDLVIRPFAVSHDAAEPVAYRVESSAGAVAVATDLGEYTAETVDHLKGLDALILEANHDLRMLQVGPYPYYLKQRVMGRQGHLSNETAGRLLSELLHPGLKQVLLGHLSKENNYAELAYETVRLEVALGVGGGYAKDLELAVAPRNMSSRVVRI